MWRPEGWVNPYKKPSVPCENPAHGKKGKYFNKDGMQIIDTCRLVADDESATKFEVGADAMLEALKRQGQYIDASKMPYGFVLNDAMTLPRTFKGYILIIENE